MPAHRRTNQRRDNTPPHSIEAEQGVLGSMLISPHNAIAEVVEKITAEYFYVPSHQTIFNVLVELWNGGAGIDLITFTQVLRDRNLLESVGGAAAVTNLFTFVPSAANVGYYLDTVRSKHFLREIISTAEESIRRAHEEQYELNGAILDEAESRFASIRSLQGNNGLAPGVSIIDLAEMKPEVFTKDNLLGERFLCTEGGMIFVGPSGVGKSSGSAQQDISWGCGRAAFGIRPARPLKIACINAENDDGDLHEMARGVCGHLELSANEREVVRQNVIYISERAATGTEFLRLLKKLVRQYRPDIVRIDPLHAYTGGDVCDPAITTPFLRNGLNPILQEFRCAAIINHHTPKTTYRDTSNWTATDWVYAGAGNADITNWARAILVIDATRVHGIYVFRAAKRGSRIGWVDEDGHRVFDRLFCHHGGGAIFWRDATEDDLQRVALAKRGQPLKTKEDLKALVPFDEEIPKLALIERARLNGIGTNRARSLLSELVADEELFEWRIPRKGTNPEVRIARQQQTLV